MKYHTLRKSTYITYKTILTNKGFSSQEAEKILSQPFPQRTIKNINAYYAQLEPRFSHDQIVIIAASREHNDIETLLDMAKENLLANPSFNPKQICQIFCCNGTETLAIAYNNAERLVAFGLTLEQITEIAADLNGFLNIKTLCNLLDIIILLKVPLEKIMELMICSDGYKKLEEHVDFLSAQVELEIAEEQRILAEMQAEEEMTNKLLNDFFDEKYFILSKSPAITEPKPKRLRTEADHSLIIDEDDDTFEFPVPEFKPLSDEVTLYKELMPGNWAARFFQEPVKKIFFEERETTLDKSNKRMKFGGNT